MQIESGSFIWDPGKEKINQRKHGVGFTIASRVFKDPDRKIFVDSKHSDREEKIFLYREGRQ